MTLKIQLLLVSLCASVLLMTWLWLRRNAVSEVSLSRATGWPPFVLAIMLVAGGAVWNGNAVYMSDESTYQFGANLYAEGKWFETAPPIGSGPGQILPSEYLRGYQLQLNSRVFPMYPMGWPSLLAAGGFILPKPFVNPLAMGLTLMLVLFGARRWLPSGADAGALWVLSLSAMWVLNSAGFTSHPACALWTTAAAVLATLAWEKRSTAFGTMAFLCCALVFVTRPLNGFVCFGVTGLALAIRLRLVRTGLCALPGILLAVSLSQWQNLNTSGRWFVSGYDLVFAERNVNVAGSVSEFIRVCIPLLLNRLADSLACSFPALAGLVLAALLHRETRRQAIVLLLIGGTHIAAYSISPLDSDSPIGERYFHEGWLFVAVAAGLGWPVVKGMLGKRSWTVPVCACLLTAWSMGSLLWVHHQGTRVHRVILNEMASLSKGVDLVFLKESKLLRPRNYILNPPEYKNVPVLFLQAPAPERREIVAKVLGRKRWREVEYTDSSPAFTEITNNIGSTAGGNLPEGVSRGDTAVNASH